MVPGRPGPCGQLPEKLEDNHVGKLKVGIHPIALIRDPSKVHNSSNLSHFLRIKTLPHTGEPVLTFCNLPICPNNLSFALHTAATLLN